MKQIKFFNEVKIGIVLIIFSSFLLFVPYIRNNYYNIFAIPIQLFFLFLFIISIRSLVIEKGLVIRLFIYNIVSILLGCFVYIFFNVNLIIHIYTLLLPTLVLCISSNCYLSDRSIDVLLLFYVAFCIFILMANIMYYIGEFKIKDMYLIKGKNALGPLNAFAIVIVGYFLCIRRNVFNRFILLISLFFLLSTVLIIKARTSFFSAILVLMLLVYKTRRHYFYILILITILILPFFFTQFFDLIFTSNQTGNVNKLTSGRSQVYIETYNFILRHPLLAELNNKSYISYMPHNYILNTIRSMGILVSLPFITYYFDLFVLIINLYSRLNFDSFALLTVLLFFILFFSSLSEYTYPFGPLFVCFLPYVLLGQLIFRSRVNC